MELTNWLKSINQTKENLIENDPLVIKDYPPYIINMCLSSHLDSILYANEMNKNSYLDKDMQYTFYLHSLRKRKRYSPWLTKSKLDDLECIKKYYGYSNEKAVQVLNILNKEQIRYIRKKLDTGGIK